VEMKMETEMVERRMDAVGRRMVENCTWRKRGMTRRMYPSNVVVVCFVVESVEIALMKMIVVVSDAVAVVCIQIACFVVQNWSPLLPPLVPSSVKHDAFHVHALAHVHVVGIVLVQPWLPLGWIRTFHAHVHVHVHV